MPMSTADLMKRVKKAWGIKEQWVSLYDDAYSLALPNRNTFKEQQAGQDKNNVVYDSTLQQSTMKLASTLQSTITPPFTEWAVMRPGPFIQVDKQSAAQQLQAINKAVFAALATSNFDTAVGEFYLDLCVGTGAMLVLENSGDVPFKFITVPISEIALEEGPDSSVGAIFRKYKKPVRTIPQMWKDMKRLPEIDEMIMRDGSKEILIHELTYFDPDTNKWMYSVLLDKTIDSNNEPKEIVQRSYTTNPWIIARWMKVSGETFGRGPVINALPDAKTANMAKKLELQSASLAVGGVYLARNNGVLNGNAIRIRPGAVIPVQSTGGSMGADITPLQVGGDLNFAQIVQEQLHQNIKDAMFDRTIPDQGAVRSATEWIVRQQELQEAIGAPFGRLHQEFIIPLFNRILDILYKKGIIERVKIDGGAVKVQITGALAQAQNLKETETIVNWAQTAMAITGPEVFQATAKIEDIVDKLAQLMGIDANLVRSEEEKQQLVQAAQQAVMAQQGGQGGPV